MIQGSVDTEGDYGKKVDTGIRSNNMNTQSGKCKCGCGGDTGFLSDYIPGHDLRHTYKLVDEAGGRDNLANLLSYTGPAKLDLIFFDDKTSQQIERISPLDAFCQVGDVQRNVGGHPCWLVTKVGELTVENWSKIPPTLCLPIYGIPFKTVITFGATNRLLERRVLMEQSRVSRLGRD